MSAKTVKVYNLRAQWQLSEEFPHAVSRECRHVEQRNGRPLGRPWSFAALLDPVCPREFCSQYWRRQPLHVDRGGSGFYGQLISLGELSRYLSLDEFFAQQSVSTPWRGYGAPEAPACPGEVFERMLGGKPLRLRRMERFMDPASPTLALLRSMEMTLQHPLGSLSCYVAPPAARGLGPHHDETEIFTLQISGTKRWRLFHRVDMDEPGGYQPEELEPPVDDFLLKPGDLFYLPRGYAHEVIATGEPSFSLTIVFSPFKWSALLDLLAARLGRTHAFIEALPAAALSAETRPQSLDCEFEARLQLIREELASLTVDTLTDDLAGKHVSGMTTPPGRYFEALFSLEEISPDTRLEKRSGMPWHLARKGDRIKLILPGGYALETSGRAETALRQVLAADGSFRVSEMHDSLSGEAKVALAKQLVGCGLLSPASGERELHASAD